MLNIQTIEQLKLILNEEKDLIYPGHIKIACNVPEGILRNVDCFDIQCMNIECVNIDCVNIDCFDIQCMNIECVNIECMNIECVDIECVNIDCMNIEYNTMTVHGKKKIRGTETKRKGTEND